MKKPDRVAEVEQREAQANDVRQGRVGEPKEQPVRAGSGDIAGTINDWWLQHIHNSVIARNTEAYNYLQNAMKDLERKLKGE